MAESLITEVWGRTISEIPWLSPISDLQKHLPSVDQQLKMVFKQPVQLAAPETLSQGSFSPVTLSRHKGSSPSRINMPPRRAPSGIMLHEHRKPSSKQSCSHVCSSQQVGARSPAMQEESCSQKCVRPCFISSGAGTVGGEEFEGEKNPTL